VIPLRPADIAEAVAGEPSGVPDEALKASSITSVTVDSRQVVPGTLFVAVAGERVDGHDFAAEAVAAGAVLILCARPLHDEVGTPLPCVVVKDPVQALGALASWYCRERLTCTVVAVTGSSGKTTTKDLIARVLSVAGPTVSARGSFNTEIGLPLTVLAADDQTRFLVLEMGMRGVGHIAYLVDLVQPDIAVVLNVGSAHVGMLGSREAIAAAKAELVQDLPDTAIAVLNEDDGAVRAMADITAADVVTFGESPSARIRATDVRLQDAARPAFTLADERTGDAMPVELRLSGEHYVSNACAAAAVGRAAGLSMEQIVDALRAAEADSKWRMDVRVSSRGFTVINDAYNANPESMRAALKSLVAMAAGRRTWAVLGEMRELGDAALEEHDAIGRLAVRLDVSRLVCVGEGTRVMHLGASSEGSWGEESIHVPDVQAAINLLNAQVGADDVVLVKASRAVGLERVAEALLTEVPEVPRETPRETSS
jgi:UDP-N-acetylmuramoyl-tripeptide--D-alanyl-D-alanine ligase